MTLIDVEAMRSPRRGSLQISFRRTDQDRKPARPFIRPNDYAVSIEEREAESARRIEAINAKRLEAQTNWVEALKAPKVYVRPIDHDAARRAIGVGLSTRMKLLTAVDHGHKTVAEIIAVVDVSRNTVRRQMEKMKAKGWIASELVCAGGPTISGRVAVFTITDEGRKVVKTPGVYA